MNTTKKGDELENKIYELFSEDISNNRFWAKKECCKIYQKKGYYSESRKKDIIFDLAIEIFLPLQTTFSSLVLIECKNYNKKVPVGDVEAFLMKAQQVSGGNIKAIMVSNNAFQEGTFNFSASNNIGLLRYYDRSNLDWVLTRSPSSAMSPDYALNESSIAYKGLHHKKINNKYYDFYGFVKHTYTNSLKLFISSLIKQGEDSDYLKSLAEVESNDTKGRCIVKFREASEIERICESLLVEIGYISGFVSLDKVCLFLKEHHGLDVLETESLEDGVLGQITFSPLVIEINKAHESETQKRFTLAHEIGHFLLGHSKYMRSEKCHESSLNIEEPNDIGIKDIMRMEWQANQFASYLLLPKNEIIESFLELIAKLEITNKGHGVLYLDYQKCNIDNFHKVTAPLMRKYKVSRSVTKIRLKKLGFINETQNFKSQQMLLVKPLL